MNVKVANKFVSFLALFSLTDLAKLGNVRK